MAPSQRRLPPKEAELAGKKSQPKNTEESSSSFILILVVGFLLLIAYTIWSSIETYSNSMVADMD